MLGHDLRNPLSAISAGAALLMRLNLEHKAAEIVKLMLGTAARMNRLVKTCLTLLAADWATVSNCSLKAAGRLRRHFSRSFPS